MRLLLLPMLLAWTQTQPADTAALLKQGDAAMVQHQWHDAEVAYQKAVDADPNSIKARIKLAKALALELQSGSVTSEENAPLVARMLAEQQRAAELTSDDPHLRLRLADLEVLTALRAITLTPGATFGRRIADDALRQNLALDYEAPIADATARLDKVLEAQPNNRSAILLEEVSHCLHASLAATDSESADDIGAAIRWHARAQATNGPQASTNTQNVARPALFSPEMPLAEYQSKAGAAGGIVDSADAALRIGSKIAQANLVKQVPPAYPPLAKVAGIQGEVKFRIIINETGHVRDLQLVRGHPLLVNAAKEAVLQWEYRPTLLNGRPIEVVTDVTVNFSFDDEPAPTPQQ